jgi:hypothetical protein
MITSKEVCASMDQYELQNAVEKIDGYCVPRPLEAVEPAFERAKAECLKHLRRQIECIEAITVQKFAEVRRAHTPNRPPVHLELITDALVEVNPQTRPITEDELEHEATIDMFETVCHGLADTLDQEIPGFDRYAFLRHCGILEATDEEVPEN